MTWRLPEHEHRTFARNPLEVVICQLRFDPILKMKPRVADFQDQVRSRFPGYDESKSEQVEIDPAAARVHVRRVDSFHFSSRHDPSAVALGDQSVALEYRDHRDRATLMEDARLVFTAFQTSFAPVSPTRLGLRYVNVIDRSAIARSLGTHVDWQDLLSTGFLALPENLADLTDTRFAVEVGSPIDPGSMTVRYGLLPLPGRSDLVFRLDIDRYNEATLEISDVPSFLERFADDVYRVFCRAVGPALVNWMEKT